MKQATGLFIALCWLVFFLFIIVSAFSTKRTVEVAQKWRWSGLLLIPIVTALLLFQRAWPLPVHAIEIPLWRWTLAVGMGADLLTLIGLFIALWGRVILGRNWSINPALKEDHQLIKAGPYTYVRHPMYSGLCLMAFGIVIWFGNAVGFLVFAACLFGTWFKLRTEEKLLTRQFGEEYLQYKARTKALVPFLF